jgi:hypothetical protein
VKKLLLALIITVTVFTGCTGKTEGSDNQLTKENLLTTQDQNKENTYTPTMNSTPFIRH